MWQILAESLAGTSHSAKAAPCQDAHSACVLEAADDPVLFVAVADGAGSAQFGEIGAAIACDTIRAKANSILTTGTSVELLTREVLVGLLLSAKSEIVREAVSRGVRARELACTVLIAVVGENAAAFAQVGDGAIVIPDKDGYAPVFWPAHAEYANMTDFLTDVNVEERIVFELVSSRIEEVAVFSDGLQRLALDFSTRRGHTKFFAPLLSALRDQPASQKLTDSFRAFLDSAQVNARTDDDKTLVLATRIPPGPPTTC
jgi:hypothetical protein